VFLFCIRRKNVCRHQDCKSKSVNRIGQMVQSLNKKKTNRQLMVTKILHSSTNINKTNNYLSPQTPEQ